ncbi:MAG: DUF177 domain-containing protein [Bacillota bacterium]
MKIFVPDLEKHEGEFIPFIRQVSLASLGVDLPGCDQSCMTVTFHASYVAGRVLVRGQWQVELTGECSRCLAQTAFSLTEQFTEEFIPLRGAAAEGGENTVASEGEETLVYAGEVLDLKEYLRQSFLMAQPLKILCREDCRGLCPGCGVDRNREECRCREEAIDPRLRVLMALKDKKQLQ